MKRWCAAGVALGALAIASGCAIAPVVPRVVEGRIVTGPEVSVDAYATYLEGVLAEEGGRLAEARVFYERARRIDAGDPEIATRLAVVRCAAATTPSAKRTSYETFDAALELDAEYAPALEAKAACAAAAGDAAEAARLVAEAARLDGRRVGAAIAVADGKAPAERRERLVALTLAHAEAPEAWEALGRFAVAHGDAELSARAYGELAQRAPRKLAACFAEAARLGGAGALRAGRRLAGLVTDGAPPGALPGASPLAARLAVDDALAGGDVPRALRRATRLRVPKAEVLVRAVLLGQSSAASGVAAELSRADPTSGDAAGAVILTRAVSPAGAEPPPHAGTPARGALSTVAAYALAARLARVEVGASRAWLAAARQGELLPAPPHDAMVVSLEVELVHRGVLAKDAVSSDARAALDAHDDARPIVPHARAALRADDPSPR